MTENLTETVEETFDSMQKVAKVEVLLCAELGKAKISLQDAIEYDTGSIITLDKLSNDPVNIYVNDILIAKGKIVAVEDTYGIKIVELIENKKPEEE